MRLAAPQAAKPQLAEWPVSDRFGSVFPSLNMAVKRREQALQDYRRLQAKVEKYEEKEKTGPVLAKLHQVPRKGSSGYGQWALWDPAPRPPPPGDRLRGCGNKAQMFQCSPPTYPQHTHRAPSVDARSATRSPDPDVLLSRPEKSCGLCGTTSRPRTSSSWMRCRGSITAGSTTSSPALRP